LRWRAIFGRFPAKYANEALDLESLVDGFDLQLARVDFAAAAIAQQKPLCKITAFVILNDETHLKRKLLFILGSQASYRSQRPYTSIHAEPIKREIPAAR
jgi:hypothetical protein